MGKLFNLRFDADAKLEVLPKKILEEQCIYLNKETEEVVIGRVAQYSGSLEPYYTTPIASVLSDDLERTLGTGISKAFNSKKIDAQTKLGEVGEDQFTYEFFITSKGTPEYKFRVLFMQYGITGYPVTVILEEGIADEINHSDDGYTYYMQTRKEYEELLARIFSSKRFGEILTKLMQLNN